MTSAQNLLSEIETYLADAKLKPTQFGKLVLNDGSFVWRMRNGKTVTLKTVDRVRAYIAAERAKMQPQTSKRRRAA